MNQVLTHSSNPSRASTEANPSTSQGIYSPQYEIKIESPLIVGDLEIGSPGSQAFRSIVERSITAWHSLDYQQRDSNHGKELAIQHHALLLGGLSSIEALLGIDLPNSGSFSFESHSCSRVFF